MGRKTGWIESKRGAARAKKVITDNYGQEMIKEEKRRVFKHIDSQTRRKEGETTASGLPWLATG